MSNKEVAFCCCGKKACNNRSERAYDDRVSGYYSSVAGGLHFANLSESCLVLSAVVVIRPSTCPLHSENASAGIGSPVYTQNKQSISPALLYRLRTTRLLLPLSVVVSR